MKNSLYDIFSQAWLSDCDSIWIYSDPHFGEFDSYLFRGLVNISAYDDMNSYYDSVFEEEETKRLDEEQIKKINSKCGKTSCLIILGDVGDIECVKKLKAKRKILILGNHDKGASNYLMRWDAKWWPDYDIEELKKEGYTEVLDYPPGAILYGKRINKGLFDEVYEGPLMINDRLILSHEPIEVPEYMLNIHGHCHELPYVYDFTHRNVCAEAIMYEPINLTKLLKLGLLKNTKSIHRNYIDSRLLAKEGSD